MTVVRLSKLSTTETWPVGVWIQTYISSSHLLNVRFIWFHQPTYLTNTGLHSNYVNYTKKRCVFFFCFFFYWAPWLLNEGCYTSLWASYAYNYVRHCINGVIYNHKDLIGFIHGALPVPLKLLLHCIFSEGHPSVFKQRSVRHKSRKQEASL